LVARFVVVVGSMRTNPAAMQAASQARRKYLIGSPWRWKTDRTISPVARSTARV
jgi:hypothetical protein